MDSDVLEFYLGSRYAPGGYAWVFPKGHSEANVGVGILRPGGLDAEQALDKFIKMRFPSAQSIRFLTGCVPSSLPPKESVRGNVVLVGDSAKQVNPFTGAGIANSFIAGRIAGRICGDVAVGNHPVSRLSEYDRLWREMLEERIKRSYNLRNRILFSDKKIERFCLLLDLLPSFIIRRFLNRLHY
jgi:digeranylgeranylglycerophospholipid reductase